MEIHKRLKTKAVILPLLICMLVPILFAASMKFVDRGEVSYSNNEVAQEIGYSKLNEVTRQNYNAKIDKVSDALMVAGILPLLAIGVLGVREVIRKRSLKIRAEYYIYLVMMVILAGLYFVFDHLLVINYRPIFTTPLEPSFPSTHTMLIVGVTAMSLVLIRKIIGNSTRKYIRISEKIVDVFFILAMVMMPVLRVLSGEHWLTDAVGGVIFGLAVAAVFALLVTVVPAKKK